MTDERYFEAEAEESIDVKAFLIKCFKYWYLFAAFTVVALIIAIVTNRYTVPVYKVTTYLLIKDEENPLDPQNFIGASLYGNPYKLQNEIGLIQSKGLTRRTLEELNFYTSYYKDEHFISRNLYNTAPFVVAIDSAFEQPLGVSFQVVFINDTLMKIDAAAEEVTCYDFRTSSATRSINTFEFHDTISFGSLCGNQYCRFRILPNFQFLNQISSFKDYSFKLHSISELITSFRISEVEASKNSSILELSLRCQNVQQGTDYLNMLSRVFLAKGIERDDKVSVSTLAFIDEQLKGITDSLRYSEEKLQRFRAERGVTNIDFQAQQTYEQMEGLQDQQAQLTVKSKYYSYLKEYLLKNNQVSTLIAPSSMDINDPLLNNLIIELTRLYAERTEMSFNTVKDNPYLRSLEMRISDIKAKLLENIDNIINTSDISLKEIQKRISAMESTMSRLPASQREFLIIDRKFRFNDAIYTYLLTKRAEVQISKASNIPSNEILDYASTDDFQQVSPNVKMNYLIALLLGLFLPAAFIYLRDYFRNKISGKQEIQKLTDIPVIGHIMHSTYKSGRVVHDYPNSLIAESFRSLRTNFDFFMPSEGKQVVLITSIIKGEGKSYTSVNLGTVFAQGRKKVVIIDFDLRKSKIKQYLDMETNTGLSLYLSNHAALKDIIFPSGIGNLDVIPSGPIPPNPLELISGENTEILFSELKKRYDIIIIDSPPVALVSDGLLLIKYADTRVIVVRQNYTPRNLFTSVLQDFEKREVKSLHIVLNDERNGLNGYGYGYGNGYGYGYGHEEKSTVRKKMGSLFGSRGE